MGDSRWLRRKLPILSGADRGFDRVNYSNRVAQETLPCESQDMPSSVDQLVLPVAVAFEPVSCGVPSDAIDFDDQLQVVEHAITDTDQSAGSMDAHIRSPTVYPVGDQQPMKEALRLGVAPRLGVFSH